MRNYKYSKHTTVFQVIFAVLSIVCNSGSAASTERNKRVDAPIYLNWILSDFPAIFDIVSPNYALQGRCASRESNQLLLTHISRQELPVEIDSFLPNLAVITDIDRGRFLWYFTVVASRANKSLLEYLRELQCTVESMSEITGQDVRVCIQPFVESQRSKSILIGIFKVFSA